MKKPSLYQVLALGCGIGWLWVGYNLYQDKISAGPSVCLFKQVTGWACPSCGSTRAVIQIFHGHWLTALQLNPLGLLLLIGLVVLPIWLLYDYIATKKTLLKAYEAFIYWLTKPYIAIPASVLIIINWIWNINKGL